MVLLSQKRYLPILVGSLLIESVNYRDYPAIQSLILIFSLQFIVINLIVDILYAVLNPEIKLQ